MAGLATMSSHRVEVPSGRSQTSTAWAALAAKQCSSVKVAKMMQKQELPNQKKLESDMFTTIPGTYMRNFPQGYAKYRGLLPFLSTKSYTFTWYPVHLHICIT